ncbi:MAG: dihydrolipoamide acetyltransferase component of pyruvate dehydrogenase complex [Bacteroidia bacterium]|nr:MAG: dihydrolipoamide acetyltransferase component of pyruvate dehydrogenase complex [Bacteroidia bacterium]
MAHIVKMPKLSDTMTEGVIVKWNKKVGDKVKSGDILAEIETDKATMEFESFYDGVLLHIGVPEKKAVPVDAVIAIIGNEGEDIQALLNNSNGTSSTPAPEKKSETTSASTINVSIPPTVHIVKMPKLSDTMTEGVVAKWNKKVGDKVKSGEILAEIETDKATMEFESFYDGVLLHIGVQEKQSAPVDSLLAIIGKGDEDVNAILGALNNSGASTKTSTFASASTSTKTETTSAPVVSSSNITSTTPSGRIKASPLAKRLAKEKGIDLSQVKGTGENGRITKRDVENFKPVATSTIASTTEIYQESYRDEELTQMRKTIARRLTESKNSAPHYYLTIDVDMDNAIAFRNMANQNTETKISFNDIIIKAAAISLRKHPKVNCSWLGDKIRYYNHIHIGVAVAIEDGLIVPVIRFADQKSLLQISAESKALAQKAKERKLQPKDWEGNTFTVSNLGMFGISQFTSIINSPESCILSVGAIRAVPVVKNNQVVPGNVMTLTMACDHRTVDGATGAAFLQTLKSYLENPISMLL